MLSFKMFLETKMRSDWLSIGHAGIKRGYLWVWDEENDNFLVRESFDHDIFMDEYDWKGRFDKVKKQISVLFVGKAGTRKNVRLDVKKRMPQKLKNHLKNEYGAALFVGFMGVKV